MSTHKIKTSSHSASIDKLQDRPNNVYIMTKKEYLQSAYLFQDVAPDEIEQIAAVAEEIIYDQDKYVYKQGEKGLAFYLIIEGKVELIVRQQGEIACVTGHVGSGGHFGEGALLTGNPRSISVRTLSRVRLLVFDYKIFHSILLTNSNFHLALDKALAERLSLASHGRYDFKLTANSIGDVERIAVDNLSAPPERVPQGSLEHITVGPGLPGDMHLAKKIRNKILRFARNTEPVLITGESGTGRRLAAKQIHLNSRQKTEPYIELDLRQLDPLVWEGKIFGYEQDAFPFSEGRQLGVFEQLHSGTVVLHHAEMMPFGLQRKLVSALTTGRFSPVDSSADEPLRVRIILIVECGFKTLQAENILIPELFALLERHIFSIPPPARTQTGYSIAGQLLSRAMGQRAGEENPNNLSRRFGYAHAIRLARQPDRALQCHSSSRHRYTTR